MNKLATVSRILATFCRSVAGIFMILMMALVFAEVISRYVFGESHDFVPEFSAWFMIWMTYLMIGEILRGRENIKVDILPTRLPQRYQPYLLTFLDIASLSFAILLCWTGIEYSQIVKQSGIHSPIAIAAPMWIIRLSVPLGGLILAYFSIEHLIADISYLKKNREGNK